ncbi:hypothetical protein FQZ97_1132600 [compost metagenome]
MPILLVEMPKPSTSMASKDSGSEVLSAKVSRAAALISAAQTMTRFSSSRPLCTDKNIAANSAPQPAAPHSQPSRLA